MVTKEIESLFVNLLKKTESDYLDFKEVYYENKANLV